MVAKYLNTSAKKDNLIFMKKRKLLENTKKDEVTIAVQNNKK
jgi:hypothetical protein